ncbi:pilus assembly protein TadG-related protein [Dendrosporobacter sp. 1207_IL3150]|uniref:pilus assembly protein TadG-related protein n=1 Tax=Dendrosporobacter sp. 1207_IL3150 TaxID=3084054 RepID=UPI002FD9878C
MLSILRQQKGSVIVMTALYMTALMGFGALSVDVGTLYLNRTQLSKEADSAALAGAADLPYDSEQAVSTARSYASINGKQGDSVQAAVTNNNTVVAVTVTRNVPLLFAKVFSMNLSNVKVTARAANRVITGVTGAVPLGIEKQTLIYGQTYTLKEGGGSGTTGNYDGLSLGGSGASLYLHNLTYGYSGSLQVGQWVDTEPGNMSGPTSSGISYRISQDPHATYETVKTGSPRIVVVPVVETLDVEGRKPVQIAGFAAFFIEEVGSSGNENFVKGKFLRMYSIGETSDSGTDYGLRDIRLIE